MQTQISPELADDPRVAAAEKILRKCVHCGFCLATCPTYTLLGDELDSPRGRIYLIKQVVEGHDPSERTLYHLDRCLTCRSCETTCPSGVEYGHLVDQGRSLVEERVRRPFSERLMRSMLLKVLPYPKRIGPLTFLGQRVRPLMPGSLKASVPPPQTHHPWPTARHERSMLVLEGCVQPSMTPATNAAMARVLDACGITLRAVPEAGCCGAVHFHLNEQENAKDFMRRNIDAWWPAIDAGAEAIVVTASGCGVMVKDYGHVLADDRAYADKAARVSELCVDPVEVLDSTLRMESALPDGLAGKLSDMSSAAAAVGPVAFHPPCTLQHGQKLTGRTEALLVRLGFTLLPLENAHLCCGSAGTYSIFQPELAGQLRRNKIDALTQQQPTVIATANIGCQLHLQTGLALGEGKSEGGVPVVHWIELVDRVMRGDGNAT